MMKRTPQILAVLSIFCALFLWSCKKDDPVDPGPKVITDDFNLVYTESGIFPAGAQTIYNAAPIGFKVDPAYSASFPSNVDAELAKEGTTRDKVISIKGKSLEVEILNPATQNLDFMDSIWVYVQKYNSSDPRILFGTKFNYALGLKSLSLDMTETDVKEVFNADSVTLILAGTKRAGSHNLANGTEIQFKAEIEGVFDITP